jgi:hypothetical protein
MNNVKKREAGRVAEREEKRKSRRRGRIVVDFEVFSRRKYFKHKCRQSEKTIITSKTKKL